MKTRRWIALGVLIPGLIGGCGPKVAKSWDFVPEPRDAPAVKGSVDPKVTGTPKAGETNPTGSPVGNENAAPGKPGDRMDASAGTAEALAQKADTYTKELTALMQARKNAPQPPASPSQVQWIDSPFPTSSDIRLGGEPQARPAAAVQQPAQSSDPGPAVNPDPASLRVPPPAQQQEDATKVTPITLADATPKATALPAPISTDPLVQRAEARLKNSPRDVWLHTEYQFLRLLRDEPTPEMAVLSNLPQEDRELVTALVDGMANFRSAMRQDSNMLLSSKIRPIVEMAERLQQQAELTIPTLALCTKVEKFGVYDPIEPARFPAERDNQAIVYVEIGNFMSTLTAGQTWTTQLKWDMTLFTDQGTPVWSEKTQEVEDAARTKRRDFFVRKLVTLPRTLPVGRYLLKVTLVDKQSNRVAEATAPLVIAVQ